MWRDGVDNPMAFGDLTVPGRYDRHQLLFRNRDGGKGQKSHYITTSDDVSVLITFKSA